MTFNEYQEFVLTANWPGKVKTRVQARNKLLEEADEAAAVCSEFDETEDMQEELRLELGDVLNLVITVADKYSIPIYSIIEANVEKLVNREKYGKHGYGVRS